MGDTWITDVRHFLDEEGEIAPPKGPARKFAEYITAIVALTSHPAIVPPEEYLVRCRRRPGRKPCTGMIDVDLDWETDDIVWHCPICQDMGRISNWRGSKWDLSGDNPEQTAYASDQEYDTSWDLTDNEEAWDEIFAEWTKRQWEPWLRGYLMFPFLVLRVEDDAFFTKIDETESFRLDHSMEVLDIIEEDDLYGIIVKVRDGRKTGYVPLCDLEVSSKEDDNYWPVREYAVWFANR